MVQYFAVFAYYFEAVLQNYRLSSKKSSPRGKMCFYVGLIHSETSLKLAMLVVLMLHPITFSLTVLFWLFMILVAELTPTPL